MDALATTSSSNNQAGNGIQPSVQAVVPPSTPTDRPFSVSNEKQLLALIAVARGLLNMTHSPDARWLAGQHAIGYLEKAGMSEDDARTLTQQTMTQLRREGQPLDCMF